MRRLLGKCVSAMCLVLATAPVFVIAGGSLLWPTLAALLATLAGIGIPSPQRRRGQGASPLPPEAVPITQSSPAPNGNPRPDEAQSGGERSDAARQPVGRQTRPQTPLRWFSGLRRATRDEECDAGEAEERLRDQSLKNPFLSRGRVVTGAFGAALLVAAIALWYPLWQSPITLLGCAALYYIILRAAPYPPFEEWPPTLLLGALLAHPICMMVVRASGDLTHWPLLRTLLLAYVPVFLLLNNHVAVLDGASPRDGSRPPRRIRTGNRNLALTIAALVILIANLRTLRDAFYAAGNWLLALIARFVSWLLAIFAPAPTPSAPMGPEEPLVMEALPAAEASAFWLVMEKIFIVIALIACVVLAVLAVIHVARLLRKLFRWLAERLRMVAHQLGEDVQEKTESILDWEEIRDVAQNRIRRARMRWHRPPRWEDMDNRARVRWVYARWSAGTKPSATAREAMRGEKNGPQMADIYDRARYSDTTITDGDAAFMRDAARREE